MRTSHIAFAAFAVSLMFSACSHAPVAPARDYAAEPALIAGEWKLPGAATPQDVRVYKFDPAGTFSLATFTSNEAGHWALVNGVLEMTQIQYAPGTGGSAKPGLPERKVAVESLTPSQLVLREQVEQADHKMAVLSLTYAK